MAGLDNIPEKHSIDIEVVKLDENVLNSITEVNNEMASYVSQFGEYYLRKKELAAELIRTDEILEKMEDEFKGMNFKLKEILDSLDDKYPQGRLNLTDGTVQYQPGALSRKQQAAQQAQPASGMKVVKQ